MASQTPEGALSQEVERLTSVQEWRRSPEIHEQRYILPVQPNDIPNNLTTTTLSKENALPVPPFVFVDDIKGSLTAFYYLGEGLAGHSGVLHGGMLGVLLDECLGRACFPLLPNRLGVTASLEILYKAPILLPAMIQIKADTVKIERRKAWVKASVTSLEVPEVVFAAANALFIEPKDAASMNKII